jgi:predicted RNA-binding protein
MRDMKEELVMKGVDIVIPKEKGIYLRNIFGEQRLVKACIKEMNLVNHPLYWSKRGVAPIVDTSSEMQHRVLS